VRVRACVRACLQLRIFFISSPSPVGEKERDISLFYKIIIVYYYNIIIAIKANIRCTRSHFSGAMRGKMASSLRDPKRERLEREASGVPR